METKPVKSSVRPAVVITLTLLIVFGCVFLLVFLIASENPAAEAETLTADSFMPEVNRLLAGSDSKRGEILVKEKYECHVCHVEGSGKIAPDYTGLADRAATSHPPLQAAAYIYESVVHPAAHLVEGFSGAMPVNYGSRLSDRELGDIIAYLLTQ